MHDPQLQHIALMDNAPFALRKKAGEDFKAWQEKARAKLYELLGMERFEKCEDKLAIEWQKENELFDEYHLTYNTEENFRTIARLRIPKKPACTPIPVMICLQGHAKGMHISLGEPKYEGDEQTINGGDRDFARQCIAQGYAAIALEQRGFGDCGGSPEGPQCHIPAMTALMLGRTLIGERVWDISRTIDMLENYFPQLDKNKIGIMGNSGGGTATIYAAAMEPRLSAAMPSCAFCGYKESIGVQKHCVCNFVPKVFDWFDMGDLMAIFAPKPVVIVNGLHDVIFPIGSAGKQFDLTKSIYEELDAGNLCRHVIGQEGHRFYALQSWKEFNEISDWKK